MRVRDALLVEGTSQFVIHCYGVYPLSESEVVYQAMRTAKSVVYKFVDDGWPNCVLLSETMVVTEDKILSAISAALTLMIEAEQCLAAVCMYDGAFGSYDDIFGPVVADQTYAFCFSKGEQVVNLDADLLSSKEWASVIARCRHRLE